MAASLTANEALQLQQTIEMFEVITQSQPHDYQSLEILKEAYSKLGRQGEVVLTSKRIAEAYVQLGQLSSAILEYESILQQVPDDPDVQKALAEIENRATSVTAPPGAGEPEMPDAPAKTQTPGGRRPGGSATALEIDDGRQVMRKLFVDGKLISAADFDLAWLSPSLNGAPPQLVEPFLQVLADRGLLPVDQSLRIVADKARIGFLPIEKYDVDVELARGFSREVCLRWCVLPFDRMSKSTLVATANPFNRQAARDLEGLTKNRILWYLSSPSELARVVKKVFR